MRNVLEFVRAVIVVSAMPVVIMLYAASSRAWFIGLLVYVVVATLVLLVLNRLLKGKPSEETKATTGQSSG